MSRVFATMSDKTTPPTERGGILPDKPTALFVLLAALAWGLYAAIYLAQHKLRITLDPAYESSCNLGGAINCDKVNVSEWSDLFGIPISIFAIPTYLVMAWLAVIVIRAIGSKDGGERRRGEVALQSIAGIGLLATFVSAYLAYISSSEIQAYCIYCISMYAVGLAALILPIIASPKGFMAMIGGAIDAFRDLAPPIIPAMGVTVIVGGISILAYDSYKAGMEASYREQIDAQFASMDGGFAPVEVAPAEAGSPGQAAQGAVAPAPTPAPQPVVSGALPGKRAELNVKGAIKRGKKSKDGWTYFETPLDPPNEHWKGNPNATVTVVKFADFQCGYCKFLAKTMEPVIDKYKDRVRFVMKHFPMNIKCNSVMAGYDKHPHACEAAWASHCAGLQGKFWEYHDVLYADQDNLDPTNLRAKAQEVGLDLAKYDACYADPDTKRVIQQDVDIALAAGIYGTPRTYINNRLVTGSASRSILEYYIDKALESAAKQPVAGAATAQAPTRMAPKPDGSKMIAAKTASKAFFIDPYEAAISKDGKAVSLPGVEPAEASWFDAKAACEKAGKRLCTEEEWISACTGVPAVDNNNNGWFSDDTVEGGMYPYGDFYETGYCHDQGDKYEGRPIKTGSKDKCRTPSGIFDLPGNIGEWVNHDEKRSTLMGGTASSGERAACNQRSYGSGAGRRNHTTGFRCCADTNVAQTGVSAADLKADAPEGEGLVGKALPKIDVKSAEGTAIDASFFKGKVTLVNFFASWCGPCKKELPYLKKYYAEMKARGFQVVAIGVDGSADKSIEFAKGYGVNFPIVTDPDSILMGTFGVHSMPATFLVDRQGVIRYYDTGFKPEEQALPLKQAIERLL